MTFIYRILHSLANGRLRRILCSAVLSILVPLIASGYFTVLGTFSEFAFVKDFKPFHFVGFLSLLCCEAGIRVTRQISDNLHEAKRVEHGEAFAELLSSVSTIIGAKQIRFRKFAKEVDENPFPKITQPIDQLEIIATAVKQYLDKVKVDPSDMDVSVALKSESNSWSCIYRFQKNCPPLDAGKVMRRKNSTAYHALSTGREVFLPSKIAGEKSGQYVFLTKESKEQRQDGSIYCYPVSVELCHGVQAYMVTIVTYGKCLCSPSDKKSIEVWRLILREFVRRIELELVLHSIKRLNFPEGKVEQKP